ncbi:MAG: SCO family protein [FCB group bacterium]|nr:SCO family protein [FCB group bacterium]
MITLTSPSGKVLTPDYFSSDITVVEFIFLSCTGACPIMNTHLKAVYQQLDPSLPVQFLSVSVDPDRDTLERLIEFQSTMGVDSSRWTFARGNVDAIYHWIEDQFHLGVGSLPAEHPTRLVLIDRNQEIRGYFDGLSQSSVAPLVDAIHQLLAEETSGTP